MAKTHLRRETFEDLRTATTPRRDRQTDAPHDEPPPTTPIKPRSRRESRPETVLITPPVQIRPPTSAHREPKGAYRPPPQSQPHPAHLHP